MPQRPVVRLILPCCILLFLTGCALVEPFQRRAIVRALESPDPQHRTEALVRIRGRVSPQMRVPLEEIIQEEMSPTIRGMAVDALGELGSPESIDELRLSGRRDASWIVRRRALHAMAMILGPQMQEDLHHTLTNDPNETVRAEGVKLAGEHLEGHGRNELLLLGLRDESRSVQLTAHGELFRVTGEDIPPGDHSRWREALQVQ